MANKDVYIPFFEKYILHKDIFWIWFKLIAWSFSTNLCASPTENGFHAYMYVRHTIVLTGSKSLLGYGPPIHTRNKRIVIHRTTLATACVVTEYWRLKPSLDWRPSELICLYKAASLSPVSGEDKIVDSCGHRGRRAGEIFGASPSFS